MACHLVDLAVARKKSWSCCFWWNHFAFGRRRSDEIPALLEMSNGWEVLTRTMKTLLVGRMHTILQQSDWMTFHLVVPGGTWKYSGRRHLWNHLDFG